MQLSAPIELGLRAAKESMIIDSHSHWLPEKIIKNANFFSNAWGDIEALVKMMDRAGIDKTVLTYPSSDAHLKLGSIREAAKIFNDGVAKILKRYPDKFIAAATLPLDEPDEIVNELKRTTQELGFKAVSLASSYNGIYLDDKIFLPVYKYAQQNNLPVFVHAQIINPIGYERIRDPLLTPVIEYVFDTTICIGKLLMSGILAEYAEVKFVFAYFGGVISHLANRFDATYQMLRKINFVRDLNGNPTDFLKNIYVDTSGDTKMTNLLSALELVGAGHILWGSDWPAKKDIKSTLDVVKNLNLEKKDKEGILGENLARILR